MICDLRFTRRKQDHATICMRVFSLVRNGLKIISDRLHEQGLWTTLVWLYVQSLSFVTGVPILRFCKINNCVYVGPQYRRLGKQRLRQIGINAGINLRAEFNDEEHGLALEHYCYLPTVDGGVPSLDQLYKGVNFIRHIAANGGKVYVHCSQGVGRAPTMVAAYLIAEGHSSADAIQAIIEVRPFIRLTMEQRKQLDEFYQSLSSSIHYGNHDFA